MSKIFTEQSKISAMTFHCPTQVRFHAEYDDADVGTIGIAYHDEIICLCCGGVVPLDEVDRLEIFDECDWIDINFAAERTMFYDN